MSLSCFFDLLPHIFIFTQIPQISLDLILLLLILSFFRLYIIKKSFNINEVIEIYIDSATLKWYIRFWKLTLLWNFSISSALSATRLFNNSFGLSSGILFLLLVNALDLFIWFPYSPMTFICYFVLILSCLFLFL